MLDPAYARGVSPVSWLGVALILVALLFFAVDLVVTNHGLLTFGGLVALVLGILTLSGLASPYSLASLVILVALAVVLLVGFVGSTGEVIAARGRPAATGVEGMIGEVGVVRETVGAGASGWVFVHGELWRAVPAVPPEDTYRGDEEQGYGQEIGVGRRVQVVDVGDGRVVVLPFEPAASGSSSRDS